jgi:hypothetical protein
MFPTRREACRLIPVLGGQELQFPPPLPRTAGDTDFVRSN